MTNFQDWFYLQGEHLAKDVLKQAYDLGQQNASEDLQEIIDDQTDAVHEHESIIEDIVVALNKEEKSDEGKLNIIKQLLDDFEL